MYQDTVTIYCKREGKYLPRVLHGVEAQLGTAATAKAFGIESASNGLLLVPLEWPKVHETKAMGKYGRDFSSCLFWGERMLYCSGQHFFYREL